MPERRRGFRLRIAVPVTVTWTDENGKVVREEATTEELNAYGAMLRVKTRLPIPGCFWLTNWEHRRMEGQAVMLLGYAPDGSVRVAVALNAPSDTFWA